jgi:hypothetical protein
MANKTEAAKKRTKVTAIPKPKQELTGKDLQKIKGGASDIFAKLGDIKGESGDSKHKDEIEVLGY